MLSKDEILGAAAIAAHKFSIRNYDALAKPQVCGCFYCLEIFNSSELTEEDFLPEKDGTLTAWCPYCVIDSVIGESCGYEITPELLKTMNEYWFSVTKY